MIEKFKYWEIVNSEIRCDNCNNPRSFKSEIKRPDKFMVYQIITWNESDNIWPLYIKCSTNTIIKFNNQRYIIQFAIFQEAGLQSKYWKSWITLEISFITAVNTKIHTIDKRPIKNNLYILFYKSKSSVNSSKKKFRLELYERSYLFH